MARMIGKTKSSLMWLAGMLCALVFGSDVRSAEVAPLYGIPVPPPAPPPPVERPEKPQPPASLEESREWQTITDAWAFAKPLADSGESTSKQREEADAKLKAATEAAAALAGMGLLNTSESGLLTAEADKLKTDIHRNPPSDSRVTCYAMDCFPPAQQSLSRLSARLPLLKRLTAESRLHKPAIEKVLATVEADIATLSDEKALEQIKAQRAEAEKTRDAVKAEVAKLKKLLAENERD